MIGSGVGKSGSPAPKPMTFSPAAFSALALASTASVADSLMAAMRAEMRPTAPSSRGGTPDRARRQFRPETGRIRRKTSPLPVGRPPSLASDHARRLAGLAPGAPGSRARCSPRLRCWSAGFVVGVGAPGRGGDDRYSPPEAFILVDAGTGAVITARHLHEALPPASTVKIMTALVAVERLPRARRSA